MLSLLTDTYRAITLAFFLSVPLSHVAVASDPTNLQRFNFPGGVATFNIAKQSNDIPEVKYGLIEPAIIDQGKYWSVVIGIGLQTLPGQYVAYIKHGIKGASGRHQKLSVDHFSYPYLKVKVGQKDTFSALYKRHSSMSSIDFANTQQPAFPLRLPLAGTWSNFFGHSISTNNDNTLLIPNSVSLTTTQRALVVSPQDAIVSKIEVSANGTSTVFLDHGRGVYSIISGLSDLTVEISNGIVAGAVIGKVSSDNNNINNTARLIWQVVMNGEYVSPLLLTMLTL